MVMPVLARRSGILLTVHWESAAGLGNARWIPVPTAELVSEALNPRVGNSQVVQSVIRAVVTQGY